MVISNVSHYMRATLYCTVQVSGKRHNTNVIKHMIRDSNISSYISKTFKVENQLYLTVSNTYKDCWYVVSHVSFASLNYESHV